MLHFKSGTVGARPGGVRRHGWMAVVVLMTVATAATFSGCSMAPRVEVSVPELPDEFAAAATAARGDQRYWWHGFGDPQLNQLVDSVLARNLDLRIAAARVVELQSRYRIARSGQLPTVELGAGREESNTPSNTGIGGQIGDRINIPGAPEFPDRFEITTYSASLGFAFELDFWGRVRGAKQAALREFFASRSDMRTVLVGVIGEAVAAYFEIATHQRTLELNRERVKILAARTERATARYARGLISSLELYTVQQAFSVARADVPALEGQLEAARGRLSVLLGSYRLPADSLQVEEGAHRFALEEIPGGLPSELLQERPDVVAAFQRLEAARERVGVARAAQFPSISLTGAGGTQSSALSEIAQISQKFWIFGGGLSVPVFGGGRVKANIRASWAQYEQQAAQYEKTVLTAFRDVEAALTNYGKQQERYALLSESHLAASQRAQVQERRYARGISDHQALLDARHALVLSELSLVESRRTLVGARLAVHRALGGAWVEQRAPAHADAR